MFDCLQSVPLKPYPQRLAQSPKVLDATIEGG